MWLQMFAVGAGFAAMHDIAKGTLLMESDLKNVDIQFLYFLSKESKMKLQLTTQGEVKRRRDLGG